jgi:tRNA-dihydrouridine synthase B
VEDRHQLILAPIRGITDSIYRNAIARSFGGIDYAMAPYLVTKNTGEINARQFNDLNPAVNDLRVIGQILTKDADQFLLLANDMVGIGVKEVNLNMGCPYPMVADRTKGSGLLPHPERVRPLLEKIVKNCPCHFSVKLRLGRDDQNEVLEILPILKDLGIDDVTIHPRLGRQIYKGVVNLDGFEACLEHLTTPPTYNGDIHTAQDLIDLKRKFPTITKWMIGRGCLKNPALFSILKGTSYGADEYKQKLEEMHKELCVGYLAQENAKSTFLGKMRGHWPYLAASFENEAKILKKIKKARSIDHYFDATQWIFNQ